MHSSMTLELISPIGCSKLELVVGLKMSMIELKYKIIMIFTNPEVCEFESTKDDNAFLSIYSTQSKFKVYRRASICSHIRGEKK